MNGQVKTTFTEFPDYTSIHGIGGVKRGKYLIQRGLWAVVFCGSLGMCIFQVYRLALQFSREQTTTKISEEYGAIAFPSLHLCNLNPLMYTKVKTDKDLIQVIEETAKAIGVDLDELDIPRNLVYERNYTIDDRSAAILNAKSFFRMRMGEKSDDEIVQMSQKSEDFIISCYVQGSECNRSTFRDEYYGMCHSIKVDDLIYNTGPQNGLTMILNIQSNEYIPFISESAGVIMDIHPFGQLTSIKASGMVLSTGFEFSIGLRTSNYERYAGKTERCLEKSQNTDLAYCVEQCLGHLAARTCRCTDDYNYRLSTGRTDNYFCQASNDFDCIATVKRLDSRVVCSKCKVPCRETIYDKSVTMAKWPTSTQELVLQDLLNMTQISRDDLLTIKIYFSSLSTTTIAEELAYTEENFVSDIGGQLGLWAGISVLSLAEILELLVLIFMACCRKRKTQDSANVTELEPDQKPKVAL